MGTTHEGMLVINKKKTRLFFFFGLQAGDSLYIARTLACVVDSSAFIVYAPFVC